MAVWSWVALVAVLAVASVLLGQWARRRSTGPQEQDSPAPRIVEAVASMSGVGVLGRDTSMATRCEQAMAQAILDTMAAGVTDPDVIRQAQLDARDRVLGHGRP